MKMVIEECPDGHDDEDKKTSENKIETVIKIGITKNVNKLIEIL